MPNFTEKEYKIYITLNTCTRKAMRKTTKKGGKPYHYRKPRIDLLRRIKSQFNLDTTEAHNILMSIRQKLIDN